MRWSLKPAARCCFGGKHTGHVDGATKGPPLFHLPLWVQALLGWWPPIGCSSSTATLHACCGQKHCQAPPPPDAFFLQDTLHQCPHLQNKTRASGAPCPICPALIPWRVPEAPEVRGKLCSLLHLRRSVGRQRTVLRSPVTQKAPHTHASSWDDRIRHALGRPRHLPSSTWAPGRPAPVSTAPVCFPSQSHPDPVTYSGCITGCLSSTAGKLWEGGHPGRALSPPPRKRLAPLGGRPGPICQVLWTRGHSVQHRRWARVSGWGQG